MNSYNPHHRVVKVLKIFKKHPHFKQVLEVLKALREAGYTAWLAGGCVRDGLLHVLPKDFDVATEASPDQIHALFPKALDVGKQFGVMILPFSGFQVEVTTFRNDGSYLDGRHPEGVVFSTPEEDARRRDFTVNALFYDVFDDKIYDFVNGKADLSKRRIRCVGDPVARFQEDQLRLLRGVRFSAQLGFEIEYSTWKAIREFQSPLKNISRERVIEEMEKLLATSRAGDALSRLCESPLFGDVFGEVASLAQPGVGREWQWAGAFVEEKAPMEFLWALVLYRAFLVDENTVKNWVSAQPFSRNKRRDIVNILKLTQKFYVSAPPALEILVIELDRSELSPWYFDFLLKMGELHSANKESQVEEFLSLYLGNLNRKGFLLAPLLKGADLIALGMKKGPRLGALLEKIYQVQIRDRITRKEDLLSHPEIRACTNIEV